jgi:hypothetical protein
MAHQARTRIDQGQEPTLGQLFASASRDLSSLVHDEIELAKSELRRDIKFAAAGSGMFALAAAVAMFALLLLSVAAALGIHALGITLGFSFLIAAGGYVLLAACLALIGLGTVTRVRAPERTIRSGKASLATLKHAGNSLNGSSKPSANGSSARRV